MRLVWSSGGDCRRSQEIAGLFPSFVPRGWCWATVGIRCRLRTRDQRNKAVATVIVAGCETGIKHSSATSAMGKVSVATWANAVAASSAVRIERETPSQRPGCSIPRRKGVSISSG